MAVEKGAGHGDQHECRVSGDFCVRGSAALIAETGADFSDPLRNFFCTGASCADKVLPKRLAVGPFFEPALAEIVSIIAA